MIEEIQRRVVRLRLPLVNGEYSYFSGYILGGGVIISCRHGFVNDDIGEYDHTSAIKIIAQGYDSEIVLNEVKNLTGLCKQNIILFESEKYDIVLLEDKNAKGVFTPLYLSEWSKADDWKGGGYPLFNEDEKETKGYESLEGKASAAAIDGKVLKLKTSKTLAEMKGWKEVSGSPIFPQNHIQLMGIVRNYDQAVNDQLEAVYLKRLWDDPEEQAFRDILNGLLAQQLTAVNKSKLEEFFETEDELALKIIQELDVKKERLISTLLGLDKKQIMDLGSTLKEESQIYTFLKLAFTCHYDNPDIFKDQPTQKKPYTTVLCVCSAV